MKTRLIAMLGGGLLILSVVAATGTLAGTPAPTITQHDLEQLAIVRDSPSSAKAAPAATGTTSDAAASIAQDFLGRTEAPWQVLHGSASRIEQDADETVWIVVFLGGDPPPGGPMSADAPAVTVDYTGVVIDDQTGEVLRAFGKGHWQERTKVKPVAGRPSRAIGLRPAQREGPPRWAVDHGGAVKRPKTVGIAAMALAALVVASCAPAPSAQPASAAPGGAPALSIANGTSIPVRVMVNDQLIVTVDPGQTLDPIDGSLPPLPWNVVIESPSGRQLASLLVAGESTNPNAGRAVRQDLSCGRLDVWSGPPLAGGTFIPGPSGDCD